MFYASLTHHLLTLIITDIAFSDINYKRWTKIRKDRDVVSDFKNT